MSYWPLAAIIAIVILAAYYYADRSEKRNPTTFSGSYKEYAEDFNDKFNPDDMKPITKPQAASVNTTNQPESSETDKAKSSAPKESTESDKDKSSNSSESDKEKSSTGKDSAESDSGKPAEKDTSVKDHPGFTGSYEDYRKEFGDSRKKSNDSTQNDRFDKSGVNNQHQSAAREDEASRNEYAALNQGPAGRFNTHAFGSSQAAPGADLNSNSQAGNNPTYSRPDQMTAMTAPKGYYYPPLSGQPRSGYVPRQPNYNYPGGFHAPGFNFQFRGAFHSN